MPEPSLSVLLTRHGLSEHNLETRAYMGRAPTSRLVEEGRAQAKTLGTYLARTSPVERIVASSLPRALETAELIAAQLNASAPKTAERSVIPLHADDAFWEMSKGSWEGTMPRDGVPEPERTHWETQPFGFRFPGGESFAQVVERVAPAFERWMETHPRERLLFVLHGDVVCALLYHLLRFPPQEIRRYLVAPCSVTELEREEGVWRMLRFSDDRFLHASESLSKPGQLPGA